LGSSDDSSYAGMQAGDDGMQSGGAVPHPATASGATACIDK
jgi:hypothetical protein